MLDLEWDWPLWPNSEHEHEDDREHEESDDDGSLVGSRFMIALANFLHSIFENFLTFNCILIITAKTRKQRVALTVQQRWDCFGGLIIFMNE